MSDPTRQFARRMRRQTVSEQLWLLAVVAVLMAPLMLWGGFALMHLWGWFAVPLGAPRITLGLAVGVNLLVSYLTSRTPAQDRSDDYLARSISFAIFEPAIALGIGYVVHLCIT